jgi:hypothetical protein
LLLLHERSLSSFIRQNGVISHSASSF